MTSEGSKFPDPFDDLLRQANDLSDADLERFLAGSAEEDPVKDDIESTEPGSQVEGVVVDIRSGEVLVELGSKALGVIDAAEFEGEDLPAVGAKIRATFERHDSSRELVVLSVHGVRKEVFWEEIRPGMILEGIVQATNKGGLSLDIKGVAAFLPISQIERTRVEDLSPYVGRKLRCMVTSINAAQHEIVVSRREVLDVETEQLREKTFATLAEGQVLRGMIVRLTHHGAFVDIGGIEGLLPASKIRIRERDDSDAEPLREGQQVQVQIVRLDPSNLRVSLDFKQLEADAWSSLKAHYATGDEVTGWVSARTAEGAIVSFEDGVSGLLPAESLSRMEEEPRPGAIIKTTVCSVDLEGRRLILQPAGDSR